MEKRKYFITVQTFTNTTKLGELVANAVYEKYDKTVVAEGKPFNKMVEYIHFVMDRELKANRKLKPMQVLRDSDYRCFHLELRPEGSCDRSAFRLDGVLIKFEYSE